MSVRAYRQTARAEATEETRQRIASAFWDLALEHWFDDITLEDVAQRAGVTVRTVIRQYGGKEGLVGAAVALRGPQIGMRRMVRPGDLDLALERVFENYESMGDATIRVLAQEERFPALEPMIQSGRQGHRQVASLNFAPWLEGLAEPERTRRLDALVIATDVYAWKLLRRDMGRSLDEAKAVMRAMVEAILAAPT